MGEVKVHNHVCECGYDHAHGNGNGSGGGNGSGRRRRGMFHGIRKLIPFGRKGERLQRICVSRIWDNPFQPRTYILAEPHDNLKMSIAQYGVIVPIIVNRERNGWFTLVAGQRRLQAARELGHKTIPAIIRSLSRREMMEATYLENLHREDLSRVDVVRMFDRIKAKYPELGKEELAVAMGLDPGDMEDARKLLDLPIPALEALRAGMINETQAEIVAEIVDPDTMLDVIEVVYRDKLDADGARALVNRSLHKEPPYVAIEDSQFYHVPTCEFVELIPDSQQSRYYSREEAVRKGKVACLNCL